MYTLTHKRYKWSDHVINSADTFWRALSAVSCSFGSSRFFLHSSGKVRRFLLVHFRQDYVEKQLSIRQGECRQCGTCCNLLFTCPSLTKDGGCVVYGICRPQACKVFPIDQRDIDEAAICGGQCGYHFTKKMLQNKKIQQQD